MKIDMPKLYQSLGYDAEKGIPADVVKTYKDVPLFDVDTGQEFMKANIAIRKVKPKAKGQRLFTFCSKCGKEVKLLELLKHQETKSCKAAAVKMPDYHLKGGKERQGPDVDRSERNPGQGMGAADGHRTGRGRDAQVDQEHRKG